MTTTKTLDQLTKELLREAQAIRTVRKADFEKWLALALRRAVDEYHDHIVGRLGSCPEAAAYCGKCAEHAYLRFTQSEPTNQDHA